MPQLHKDTIGEVVAIVAGAVVAGRDVVADVECAAGLVCTVHYGHEEVAPISSYHKPLEERVLCSMQRDRCNSYVCVCCR